MSEHKNIYEAFAAAQAEFPEIPKDRENPFYHSRYSTLDAIVTACRPKCNLHGITLHHKTAIVEGLGPCCVAVLTHTTGGTIENPLPLSANFNNLTVQAQGSELTYKRRYSAAGVLGVTSDEDDDGNAGNEEQKKIAGEKPKATRAKKPEAPAPPSTVDPEAGIKAAEATVAACVGAVQLLTKLRGWYGIKPPAADLTKWTRVYKAAVAWREGKNLTGKAADDLESYLCDLAAEIETAETESQSKEVFG